MSSFDFIFIWSFIVIGVYMLCLCLIPLILAAYGMLMVRYYRYYTVVTYDICVMASVAR